MKSVIHLGNDIDYSKIKTVLPELTEGIMDILTCSAGDAVKMKALDVIQNMTSLHFNGVDLSNNQFNISSSDVGSSESPTQAEPSED